MTPEELNEKAAKLAAQQGVSIEAATVALLRAEKRLADRGAIPPRTLGEKARAMHGFDVLRQTGIRERVATASQEIQEPFARLIDISVGAAQRGIERVLGPGERGGPEPERTLGQDIAGALVPTTPEGVAATMLPATRAFATPLKMLLSPAITAGAAAATGGTLPETLIGAVQGAVPAAAGLTTRGTLAVARRVKLPGVKPSEAAIRSVGFADTLRGAAIADVGEMGPALAGKTAGESLIRGPAKVHKLASERFQTVEDGISMALGKQTLDLPILAQVRGRYKTVTTPATPTVLGPGGQPIAGGPGGSQQVLDTAFEPTEAMNTLKNVAARARMGMKSGRTEPALTYPSRELDRITDLEFRDALVIADPTNGPRLAASFESESGIFRRAMRLKEALLTMRSALEKGGTTLQGGVDLMDFRRAILTSTAKGKLGFDYESLPALTRAIFGEQAMGAREVSIPGIAQRLFTGRGAAGASTGIQLGPRERIAPMGHPLGPPSTIPGRVAGGLAVPISPWLLRQLGIEGVNQ